MTDAASETQGAEQPVIGVGGADAPRHILLASQTLPQRIVGSWQAEVSEESQELLGAADAVSMRVLDHLLSEEAAGLAGLVVCNDSMANLRLFYVARILAQRGRLPFPVHLLDAPRGTAPHHTAFAAKQFARLAAFAGAAGRPMDASSSLQAAEEEHRLGEALDRLRRRRLAGQCSGAQALQAYRAAGRTAPAEGERLVDAARSPERAPARRVFITGSSHPDETLYQAVEAEGALIVGEDHDSGDAAWMGVAVFEEAPEDVFRGLAERHAMRPPLAARSLSGERAEHLARRVSDMRCDGVLALVREHDDAPAWDLQPQSAALRATSVPLAARTRIRPHDGLSAAVSAVRELPEPGEAVTP